MADTKKNKILFSDFKKKLQPFINRDLKNIIGNLFG